MKFKIGDKVEIDPKLDMYSVLLKKIGTIIEIRNSSLYPYAVKWNISDDDEGSIHIPVYEDKELIYSKTGVFNDWLKENLND
ncbi:MAG: hypothetical protein ACTSV5_04350 [Promethearchaeota archaeon]